MSLYFLQKHCRRSRAFVTRKITNGLTRIKYGIQDCLYLGNLNAKRDWGHAKDYVEMMWLMLQQESPEDYVVSTGLQYSVQEFIEMVAEEIGLSIKWQGSGVDMIGINKKIIRQSFRLIKYLDLLKLIR